MNYCDIFWKGTQKSLCVDRRQTVHTRGVASSKYVGWTDMASAEREPITGVWGRSDPPTPPTCKNSSDLYQFQERPLAKVGWTCQPQSTPWRRHWFAQILLWRHLVAYTKYTTIQSFLPCIRWLENILITRLHSICVITMLPLSCTISSRTNILHSLGISKI